MRAVERFVALAAFGALVAPGCGGGSSTSSDYPAVTGNYGAINTIPGGTSGGDGMATQRWIAADGSVQTISCSMTVISRATQNGAGFSGYVQRGAGCDPSATFTGEVSHDGSIRITLTQARWRSCTAGGPAEYTGVVANGSLLAKGQIAVRCDDGTSYTVEEQLNGSLPRPPTTN